MKSDLVIVTTEPFPIGMAATNRIISYAKVVAEKKLVHVLIPQPTENKERPNNTAPSGTVGQLRYEYTNRTTIWPAKRSKLVKLYVVLIGLVGLVLRLCSLKPKTVIIYSSRGHVRALVLAFRYVLGYSLVCEENEYPKVLNISKSRWKVSKALNFYRKCDGMIVMTEELRSYYASITDKPLFRLPMTVELDKFVNVQERADIPFDKYFVYVGGGGGWKRDGVINIVEAFGDFHAEYSDYRLIIIGPHDTVPEEFSRIESIVRIRGLDKSVLFLGALPSNEIPGYLSAATAVVMAPQKNYTSGGFPTKLGEFLASGRPVITTSVSEIPEYLGQENSFIVPPGSNNLLVDQMIKVASDTEAANRIGLAGRKVAEEHFRPECYIDQLITHLGL